jgi:hypothetical protein
MTKNAWNKKGWRAKVKAIEKGLIDSPDLRLAALTDYDGEVCIAAIEKGLANTPDLQLAALTHELFYVRNAAEQKGLADTPELRSIKASMDNGDPMARWLSEL